MTTATVLRSDVAPGSPAGGSPVRAFDLAPLNAAYLAFAERYEPLLEHVRSGGRSSAEALGTRTRLRRTGPTSRRATRTFPPSSSRRLGTPRARSCFLEIYDTLGALAELRFRQVLAETDPALASLATHHDSATVSRLHDELGSRSADDSETSFERARREQVFSELLPQEQGAAQRRAKR